MRILLTGTTGQLGTQIAANWQLEPELICSSRTSQGEGAGSICLDLSKASGVKPILDKFQPAIIINTAAFTAVDSAEDCPDKVRQINTQAPAEMANWCAASDALLVQLSTDYVFDGQSSRPYRESDPTNPLNVYGASKLEAEQRIKASGCNAIILRTSWIYSGRGNNFLLTMLAAARSGRQLSVVNDQIACPTYAGSLAKVIETLCGRHLAGHPVEGYSLFHYADNRSRSWYDFALDIFTQAAVGSLLDKVPEVRPVGTDDFPTNAVRPRYSVLDCGRLKLDTGIEQADYSQSLMACLNSLESAMECTE